MILGANRVLNCVGVYFVGYGLKVAEWA